MASQAGAAASEAAETGGSWMRWALPLIVLLAFGISALVGIVFGLEPARRAAGMDPIAALRFE